MLHLNWFADGTALLETAPQGDRSIPVEVDARTRSALLGLLSDEQASAALAQLFIAGMRHRIPVPHRVEAPV